MSHLFPSFRWRIPRHMAGLMVLHKPAYQLAMGPCLIGVGVVDTQRVSFGLGGRARLTPWSPASECLARAGANRDLQDTLISNSKVSRYLISCLIVLGYVPNCKVPGYPLKYLPEWTPVPRKSHRPVPSPVPPDADTALGLPPFFFFLILVDNTGV